MKKIPFRKAIRVYADTSVFGGVFDPEFEKPSLAFFDRVRNGHFLLVTSSVIEEEIEMAPERIGLLLDEMNNYSEFNRENEEAMALMQAYLRAGIVGPRSSMDALHVALATVAECAIIVSWNYKHIVNFDKIPLYCAVNLTNGYKSIAIHTPMEVIQDEKEEI